MGKTHDENQVIKELGKRFKINQVQKKIKASKAQIIGNKTRGKLDFLTKYCGYTLIWDDEIINASTFADENKKKDLKNKRKEAKQHNLSNKNKRPTTNKNKENHV